MVVRVCWPSLVIFRKAWCGRVGGQEWLVYDTRLGERSARVSLDGEAD